MANNYTIQFKSLRAGTTYTLAIGGGTGTAIPLLGGAEPFTTEEDSDEDQFTPIRTQSGTIRIVDNGKAADGVTAFDWHDLLPKTDTARPVTLSHQVSGSTVIDWQGFIQAQNYGSTLYGNPQEHEFPVQCPLTVLGGTQVKTDETVYKNFAYLLSYIFSTLTNISITGFVFQGGADARTWLRKKLDWRNLMKINDGDVSPAYNLYDVLEDVCRFWGWTVRIHRETVYFTAIDDAAEPNALVLTSAQLASIGNETTGDIGTVESMTTSVTVSGDVFASMDNDDFMNRGYSKAIVKADCNKSDSELEFAPQSVETIMEQGGYTWVGDPDNARIGYFTTPEILGFTSDQGRVLSGGIASSSVAGFARRQIYTDQDATTPDIVDEIVIRQPFNQSMKAYIESTYEMSFPGGSFKIDASIFEGFNRAPTGEQYRTMHLAIGIGTSRSNAMWLNTGNQAFNIYWSSTKQLVTFSIKDAPALSLFHIPQDAFIRNIPVDSNLFGRVFIEFYGSEDLDDWRIGKPGECNFEIADFKITFSRDAVAIVDSHERKAIKKRYNTREYTSTNNSMASDELNIDCIYASDNEMEYGFGLVMNSDGTFMASAPYGNITEQPEQHLANRVTTYWAQAKRMLSPDLIANASIGTGVTVMDITPRHKVTLDGTTFHPIAINHDWRDDVISLTLLEMPT
jgi:hypothetical protein